MSEVTEKVRWEPCARCHSARESRLDLNTGRYVVWLPSRCPTKDKCHAEMKPGV